MANHIFSSAMFGIFFFFSLFYFYYFIMYRYFHSDITFSKYRGTNNV